MKSTGHGLGMFLKITIVAIVGILIAKWVFNKINVPGLTTAINAV